MQRRTRYALAATVGIGALILVVAGVRLVSLVHANDGRELAGEFGIPARSAGDFVDPYEFFAILGYLAIALGFLGLSGGALSTKTGRVGGTIACVAGFLAFAAALWQVGSAQPLVRPWWFALSPWVLIAAGVALARPAAR